MLYVKQHQSSPLSAMEIKNYVQDIGNQRFSDAESHTSSGQMKFKDKASYRFFLSSLVFIPFFEGFSILLDYQLEPSSFTFKLLYFPF